MSAPQNLTYPYLPEGREILYVGLDNEFMKEAKRVRDEDSTDFMNPTGAVCVKDGKILIRAANQAKIKSKKLRDLHSKYCIRRILHIPSGKGYFMCPGCATSKQHAESQAAAKAKKQGIDLNGADLYLYGHYWCCKPCWDAMIKAGIKNVYLVDKAWEIFQRPKK